ncbi:MAG TPA: YkgJ family cysteine cluster protein [Gemmatimonadales bacterium]
MAREFTALPCLPCPHRSACCAYGTTLTPSEAAALAARHGQDTVYRTRWGEWRTRVRKGRCVFLVENLCTIHDDPNYPAVCRGFPWTDPETGGDYLFDQTICPEFLARPELVQIRGTGNGERGTGRTDRGAKRKTPAPAAIDI